MNSDSDRTYEERLAWRALKGNHSPLIDYRDIKYTDLSGSIINYVERGFEPGSFCKYMIIGDCHRAWRHMHTILKEEDGIMQDMIEWFDKHAPELCYGSLEKYNNWVSNGGIFGIEKDGKKVHLKVDLS